MSGGITIALRLPVPILHLGRVGVLLAPLLGEPCVLSSTESGHHLHELGHGLGLVMTVVPHEELSVGTVLERGDGLGIIALDDLIFLFHESGPVTAYCFVVPLPRIGLVTSVRGSDVCTSEVPQELGPKVCPAPDGVGLQGEQPSPS